MEQQLHVFMTVAQMENFSRAAEALHMTQPAVSQHIQALERFIGSKLLERSSKFVRLNKAGEIVYKHAKEILNLYSRMQDSVDDLTQSASGEISIGASYTYGEYVLPHIIAKMRKRYPQIRPKITIGNTNEIANQVNHRHLDIGIVEGNYRSHKNMNSDPFAKDYMYIYASAKHPFSERKSVTVDELREETWIVREVGSGTREAVDRMFSELKFTPAQLLEFGSTQIIKESVEAGLGITLLSHWATKKELLLGTLRAIEVEGIPIVRPFSLIAQASLYQTKAMTLFWDLVLDYRQ